MNEILFNLDEAIANELDIFELFLVASGLRDTRETECDCLNSEATMRGWTARKALKHCAKNGYKLNADEDAYHNICCAEDRLSERKEEMWRTARLAIEKAVAEAYAAGMHAGIGFAYGYEGKDLPFPIPTHEAFNNYVDAKVAAMRYMGGKNGQH